MRSSSLFIVLLCLIQGSFALDQIIVQGNLFFNSVSGNQFWVKGVDYQPKNSIGQNFDVLADQPTIDRDLPLLIELGVNAIRVYETDSTLNHDYAMGKLSTAGIYVILDVPTPSTSIASDSPMWNLDLFAPFAAKIDAFKKYDNILAYIASNEVSNSAANSDASAFVKAAVRDVKGYVRSLKLTTPVGYAIADAGDIAEDQESYFACGNNVTDPDFYGINIYRWCGDSNYVLSGYSVITERFTNWPIASMFSEYGCNLVLPRIFTEVNALYGVNMSSVFSGGLVYEYSNETNNYGLVQVNYAANTLTKFADFNNYKTRLASVAPNGTTLSAYSYTPKTVACPAVPSTWLAASSPLPPVVNATLCACMLNSYKCRINATSTSQLSGTQVDKIYGYVCGLSGGIYCSDIATNATSGSYGALSMCDAVTRVSAVMNRFYSAQTDQTKTSCNFDGFGMFVTSPSGSCTVPTSSLTTRTTVTAVPTGTTAATAATSASASQSATVTATRSATQSATVASGTGSATASQVATVSATSAGSATVTVATSGSATVSATVSAATSAASASRSNTAQDSSAAVVVFSMMSLLAVVLL